MAPRYLVFEAPYPLPEQAVEDICARLAFEVVLMTASVAVLVSKDTPRILLENGRGIILGSLFHRFGPPVAINHLPAVEIMSSASAGAKMLVERYWGSYVAVLCAETGTHVIRDPSGGLPCYISEGARCTLFASDPEILRQAGLLRPSIDWTFPSRHFYSSGLPSQHTGLEGLTELGRGTAAIFADGTSRLVTLWSPWDFVSTVAERGLEENAQRLGQTVRDAVAALASEHQHILVGVSGGLDSSLIAASLASAGADYSCITLATNDPDGDERSYARMLCASLGCELEERAHELGHIDFGKSSAEHLPRPVGRIQSLAYDAAVCEAANLQRASAFFTGNGGDNVFGFTYSAAPIVDRLLAEGFARGCWTTLADVCRLTGASLAEASLAAYRIWKRKAYRYRWKSDPEFLNPEILPELAAKNFDHPWLAAPANASPGKAAHIALLLRIQQHLDGFDRAIHPPVVNPLMTQPVIEYCLGIPSWQWVAEGRNRAVARKAFAALLPDAIISRQSKGGPDAFCQSVIAERREEVRARLLDGHLVRHGIADRRALERTLSNPAPDLGAAHVRIMAFLDTEAWLDHWSSRPFERHAIAAN